MELLQLKYFQTVARMESITKAAEYYKIPQPSMSQMISRLEHELGDVKLFSRKNGRIYLNDNGRAFLSYVDKSLANLNEGISKVAKISDSIAGPVSIKIFENHRFILTSVPKFVSIYPNVSFSTSHGYFEDQDTEYDLCVSSHISYQNMLRAEPLIKEEIVLAVHEKHHLAKKKRVSVADLEGEQLISMPRQSSLYSLTFDLCKDFGFKPQIPIVCDDPYFIRKYVSENMGIALAPSISWKGRFRENTVLVPFEGSPIFVTSYLLWDDRRYLSAAARGFRDYLLNEAKKIPNCC